MQRHFERSSGGIVYKKVGGEIRILLLKRSNSRGGVEFVLPKGHIENEETAKDTALREISEETGLDSRELQIIKFLTKINYQFIATYREGSPLIDKDVYLFLVRYMGSRDPTPSRPEGDREGFVGFEWMSLDAVRDLDMKPEISSLVKKNLRYM
jgi:8-oxo-dGTP pyrophosphatase MutT (NUDIX family)